MHTYKCPIIRDLSQSDPCSRSDLCGRPLKGARRIMLKRSRRTIRKLVQSTECKETIYSVWLGTVLKNCLDANLISEKWRRHKSTRHVKIKDCESSSKYFSIFYKKIGLFIRLNIVLTLKEAIICKWRYKNIYETIINGRKIK